MVAQIDHFIGKCDAVLQCSNAQYLSLKCYEWHGGAAVGLYSFHCGVWFGVALSYLVVRWTSVVEVSQWGIPHYSSSKCGVVETGTVSW